MAARPNREALPLAAPAVAGTGVFGEL
jgi:hypothetical protein